jgi:hypothetical protein
LPALPLQDWNGKIHNSLRDALTWKQNRKERMKGLGEGTSLSTAQAKHYRRCKGKASPHGSERTPCAFHYIKHQQDERECRHFIGIVRTVSLKITEFKTAAQVIKS